MKALPKIALGAWAWGNDGTFGNNLTPETLKPIFDIYWIHNVWDAPHWTEELAEKHGVSMTEVSLAWLWKSRAQTPAPNGSNRSPTNSTTS